MKLIKLYIALTALILLTACSATKFISDGDYLLDQVEVKSAQKDFNVSLLEPYVRQKANSKWFSLFKIPLATYSLSGTDTIRWINRTLKNIGEAPVVYDTVMAERSCEALRSAMSNMGYLHSEVELQTRRKGKKVRVTYILKPGEPYYLRNVRYDIADDSIRALLDADRQYTLRTGAPFTVERLDAERNRITNFLLENGYYKFNKDFIHFSADSARDSREIDLTLHLDKYRPNSNAPETLHPRYTIGTVSYASGDKGNIQLRPKVLQYNTAIIPGTPFSANALQKTYNNFARLKAIRYTNIKFSELPDTSVLDCDIQVSTNKPHTLSFQPEGTNTAGDLGAAASLTYENRNIFHGSELFSIELRGAFEAITGLEGYQNQDYEEYSVEAKLQFPRFVAPFLSKTFRRRSTASSELSVAWDLQNRPEFHRRVFSTAWRYRWAEPRHHVSYRFDLLDLNYVYMPWISATFKHDYLDSVSNRNAILRYNYEDLFIMKMGFGITYNNDKLALRANVETAGNLLGAFANMASFRKNDVGQHTLFNIAYAQYVKFDFDFTKQIRFDTHNVLALHGAFGIAYPYGNSTVLPFEKRYFSGGANSVRGWGVRELGPGKFKGTDGRIDFINQTGDMKLDLSAEYRTFLFWKFDGAAFIDAGNIWTLRSYAEQPGGQFKISEFYKQIAVAYGVGLRLNFGYFILRFDMGMKAINPAYENHKEHYAFLNPDFGRDFSFHFAVGLPF
ncbi:MAG: BamA/TamA family outer membrane protein [Prevotella sp.]|nr:BamA/TamA family outer membrane protein [Prevotella sp.]MCI6500838.1 BamA/TamA family outer membrane protein [Prevotella sp.]MCI7341651.1 BamA/TamA family outer membrane protein [Prevotella sp.]MCI7359957.1 BamA/TamA family outer membrane protein [Prevotella sp.]MCI7687346.1 BamA/TamA family outer membrane protein [Prevotella sp.]